MKGYIGLMSHLLKSQQGTLMRTCCQNGLKVKPGESSLTCYVPGSPNVSQFSCFMPLFPLSIMAWHSCQDVNVLHHNHCMTENCRHRDTVPTPQLRAVSYLLCFTEYHLYCLWWDLLVLLYAFQLEVCFKFILIKFPDFTVVSPAFSRISNDQLPFC